jgi:[ribosomal protein S18]-alanine N-acetyltransferase
MQEKIAITKATEIHLTQISEIGVECSLSHWSLESYREELGRSDSVFMVALAENKILGFIVMRLLITEEAEIYNFAVSRDLQNRGIGQRLFSQAVEAAMQKRKINRIWLEVRESNLTAINFYLKNGFQPAGKRKNFYTNPAENAVLMVRKMFFETFDESKAEPSKDLMSI